MGATFVHVAVDDHSRYAYVEQHADERAPTCAAFLERALAHFAQLGLEPAEAVMTDGARCYRTAVVFQQALRAAGARHIVTPPYTPRWNGKAERFIQTMKSEWAYAHEWPSSAARARALSSWEEGWMLITTGNDLPGYEITEVLGETFGLTVRSRHVGSQIGAGFKSLVGGELRGMTKMLAEGREQAIERLVEEAEAKGADAIIAMRFDTSEFMEQATEICAYGTAVKTARR